MEENIVFLEEIQEEIKSSMGLPLKELGDQRFNSTSHVLDYLSEELDPELLATLKRKFLGKRLVQ